MPFHKLKVLQDGGSLAVGMKKKWSGTVFHRPSDRSIFPSPTQIFPFPLTFRQEHFSDRISLSRDFWTGAFFWSHNLLLQWLLDRGLFLAPTNKYHVSIEFWTGVFFLTPQKHFLLYQYGIWFFFSIHLAAIIMQIMIADEDIFIYANITSKSWLWRALRFAEDWMY